MVRYKKIKINEYQLHRRDLIVFYYSNIDGQTKRFAQKLSKGTPKAVCVFNLKGNEREELEKMIQDQEIEKDKLYIYNDENATIDDIEKECSKLDNEGKDFVVIIEYKKENIMADKEVSRRLKELAVTLGIHIFVIDKIVKNIKNKKVPTLDDIENKGLIDFADTVFIECNESKKVKKNKTILAKNNYGKTGIIVD